MKTIKIVAGITWAFLCLIIVIVMFPALNPLAGATARLPFMKINPRYSGGEVVQKQQKGNYSIDIRRPVFDGLLRDKKTGFVQVDWKGELPEQIVDTIDYDGDQANDFIIQVDTLTSQSMITPINQKVKGIEVSTSTSYGWAVRVILMK